MKYRYFGATGLKVSELALGGWTFGREVQQEEEAFGILDLFWEAGGNFIDTAEGYNRGRSEEMLGSWMASRCNRDQVVVATKVFALAEKGRRRRPNDGGLSRRYILSAIDGSLRRLKTDHIDLYQTHFPDPGTHLEETLSALDALVRCGKVRYIGASNYSGWQLMKAVMTSRAAGLEPYVSIQPEYSLLARQPEWEIVPVCQDLGLALIAWSPLAGGWLAGSQSRASGGPAPGTRVAESSEPWQPDSWELRGNETTWEILAVVEAIARDRQATLAQVALNWLRAKDYVTAPIVGARRSEQLKDSLACITWDLSDEELARLDAVSALPVPYPYDLADHLNRDIGRMPHSPGLTMER